MPRNVITADDGGSTDPLYTTEALTALAEQLKKISSVYADKPLTDGNPMDLLNQDEQGAVQEGNQIFDYWQQNGQIAPVASTGGTIAGGTGGTGAIPEGVRLPSVETFRNIISLALGIKANEPWISSLFDVAKKYITDGVDYTSPIFADILLNDQNAPQEFKDRFKGIFALRAKGAKFIPSIAEYIRAEKDFGTMFRNAGLKDLDNSDFFATLVENEVDFETATKMVDNVYKTVEGADDALKRELKTYFPTLSNNDLAKSLLLGKEGVDQLSRKITQAGISSEATVRGLSSRLSVEDLAKRGVTREDAAKGYSAVAEDLNPYSKLSAIYDSQNPADVQTELESENLLGVQSKRKKKIVQQEVGAFSGSGSLLASQNRKNSAFQQ